MGGTVIRALQPVGLEALLLPINEILSIPFGPTRTIGEAILLLRHSHLVHGNFSPENTEFLIRQTDLRNPRQQMRISELIWNLFHRVMILDLQIMSILTSLSIDIEDLVIRYIISFQEQQSA